MTINSSDLLSGASSSRSTVSVVNTDSNFLLSGITTPRSTLSGGLTASTLKTMLNISGARGVMSICAVRTTDATARTIRLKITCDGTVIYDKNSAVAVSGQGIFSNGISGQNGTNQIQIGSSMIRFQSTLLVEISSSLTETDKLQLLYDYVLEA